MELFRTVVKNDVSPEKIEYETPFLMMGSCFAESIGVKLKQLKFDVVLNPFGIVYHPVPAALQLERIIFAKLYIRQELQQHNELWHSFDHHGRFSHPDASYCLEQINHELRLAHDHLKLSGWLFVTFGTAWAYRIKANGRIASNCHKFSASDFERIRVDVGKIHTAWMKTIARLRQFNPEIKIVFTVSPIRHLRDGAHENQLSKSTLLLAIDRIIRDVENCGYFPAYEMVLDELRDYRFYAEDMLHPSAITTEYIRQRFCESYMSQKALQIMKFVEEIIKASEHRPIHHTSEYLKFAAAHLEKIERLKQQMPQLDFSEEIERLNKNSIDDFL